jgi:catechol 2,3-dioxygenase-like lactoylglutathione lyase family enzyme
VAPFEPLYQKTTGTRGFIDSALVSVAMAQPARSKLIGINHVAVEVGDLDAALELYGRLFEFQLRGRMPGMAFIDMGDQFLAVAEGRTQGADDGRHAGLVVEDRNAVVEAAREAGLKMIPTHRGEDFVDPWGNRFQPVTYAEIQFERTDGVKRKLGIEDLAKSEAAREEISDAGMR